MDSGRGEMKGRNGDEKALSRLLFSVIRKEMKESMIVGEYGSSLVVIFEKSLVKKNNFVKRSKFLKNI